MSTVEHDQREAVVAEALTWLGTGYHWHARLKGVGVDCLQFLAGVFEACGLVPPVDPGTYPQMWHLHRSEERYHEGLLQYLHLVPDQAAPPRAGDVGLWRFGRTFSHSGIFVSAGEVVHAYHGRGVIVSRLHEEPLSGREMQVYSFWGHA